MMSVHNAAAGMFPIEGRVHAPASSVAAGAESFHMALVEAAGMLADGMDCVAVVDFDDCQPGALLDAFESRPCDALYATAWLLKKGAGVTMKLKRGVAHAALRTGCRLAVVHIRSSHAWLNKDTQWYEIPAVRPSISLTFEGMIDPKDYLREGEDGYSLASRRLTEAMRRELLKAAGREDEIEGKARGRRQN